MDKEILRLFKGYLVPDEDVKSEGYSEKALKYGLIIELPCTNVRIIDEAIEMYGKDGEKWNQTFHKDFEIVRNAPIEDLIQQQLIHYMTTYGFESLGIYDQDTVYIPKEKLEIPELDKDIEMTVIHPMTEQELSVRLMNLLTSGVALSEQTVKDIMILSTFIDKDRFDEIKNREIKTALYDMYNIMPKNPDEFLRYLLFKTTGETLKISNNEMIAKINSCDRMIALNMFSSYIQKCGYEKLSSIFLRNKNLFLAFKIKNGKEKKELNTIINKLRKLANKTHRPLKQNILDNLTNLSFIIDYDNIEPELDKINIFREIRILNGVLYRLNGNDNILYKIRNGKSYVKKVPSKTEEYIKRLTKISNIIKNHLTNRLSKIVKNKVICIPNNIVYSAPTSEKQFNGNIPSGSYIEIPRDDNLVYGVHWNNLISNKNVSNVFYGEKESHDSEERVDLDLKQMNKNEIFGWDAQYRSSTSDILFSGDETNAPLPSGATELFYVGKNYGRGAFLITLNMFTNNSKDVPFEFVVSKADYSPNVNSKYVLNPNNILEKIDMSVETSKREKVIGLITIGDNIRLYFNDFNTGNRSSSSKNEITMGAFDYLNSYNKVQLKLNDILRDAGAKVIDTPEFTTEVIIRTNELDGNVTETKTIEIRKADIDLSINNINKDTLIKLLSEN